MYRKCESVFSCTVLTKKLMLLNTKPGADMMKRAVKNDDVNEAPNLRPRLRYFYYRFIP